MTWIGIGVVATAVMTIFQIVQIFSQGKKSVPEFYENSRLLERVIKKDWETVYWLSLPLHFIHGIGGAIGLGIILMVLALPSDIIIGLIYGLSLWIILLIIHKPITGENILSHKEQLIGSFISHLIYGISLSLLFI